MIVFVDSESKIRAVGKTSDSSLTSLYIDETDPSYPFTGWSSVKICCYRVSVTDGIVTMMTPYVDSRMLDMVDTMGHQVDALTPYTETKKGYYKETEKVFYNVPEGNVLVFFDNYAGQYSVKRVGTKLTVSFTALEKTTNITISVQ